jgi:hypothetical protein
VVLDLQLLPVKFPQLRDRVILMRQTMIQIPDEDYAYLEQKVAAGSSGSIQDELLRLVRQERLSRAALALDQEILKSVNSGKPILADRRYWEEILALATASPEPH